MVDINLNREVVFESVTYTVLIVLENDLLLVVPKNALESEKFPIKPIILKDTESVEALKSWRKNNGS